MSLVFSSLAKRWHRSRNGGRAARRAFLPSLEALEDRCVPSATYSQAVLADGPAAYYRLDEASGLTANSLVNSAVANGKYSASGVAYNQPGAITDDPDPSVSLSAASSGTVITGNLTTVAAGPSVTLSIWFKATAGAGGANVVVGGVLVDELGNPGFGSGWHDSQIELENNGNVMVRVWNLTPLLIGNIASSPTGWHNAVAIYTSSTTTLSGMLDGVASATSESGSSRQTAVTGGGAQFWALGEGDGTNMGNGSNFTGGIDEFAAFNSALTNAQLTSLYQVGIANDVQFSAANYTVAANAGNALITITRDANPTLANLNQAESVTFSTANGTAVAGTNYTAVTNLTVNFAVGQATATVMIPVFNVAGVQPNLTVNLSLTAVANSAILFPTSGSTAVLTILDVNTTTAVTSSQNPTEEGQAVTLTATVTGGGVTPTGTISFLDNGSVLAVVALNSSGVASFTTSQLPPGSDPITAKYSGDNNYLPSSAQLTQTVIPPSSVIATGTGPGTLAQVNVYNAAGQFLYFLQPFGPTFTGGVRVAVGDVNGDGVSDIICAAGPGGGPEVAVYNGTNGQLLYSFFAISGSGVGSPPASSTQAATFSEGGTAAAFGWTGGMFVAAGNLFGLGYDDIIVSADKGGGPEVQVFDGKTGALVTSFDAFASTFRGGVRVAAADVIGNGRDEILCAAGPGGGPQIAIWDGLGQTLYSSFYAFAPSFTGGVFVAGGNVLGTNNFSLTGYDDIIAGAGAGGGPQVAIFDGKTHTLMSSFYAMAPNFTGGITVAVSDPRLPANIIVGAGPSGGPQVASFDASTMALLGSFFAYNPTATNGVFVN